ncbi:MAG: hypothetical protein F6J93_35060 [Oscillatoria sp. SIO1A7]|nr:hypothetical protein [Oscillatoria sp. SIO1A7]
MSAIAAAIAHFSCATALQDPAIAKKIIVFSISCEREAVRHSFLEN